jgi:uncharacterized protein (DUF433 family)
VVRVTGTRVRLDVVVTAFHGGSSAEDIARKFPAVPLSAVYQTIGYYLKHKQECDVYLDKRKREQDALLAENLDRWSVPVGARANSRSRVRLLSRIGELGHGRIACK